MQLDKPATSKNRCPGRNVFSLASDKSCKGPRVSCGIGIGPADCRFDTRATAAFGVDSEFPTDQVKSFAHANQSESGSWLGGVSLMVRVAKASPEARSVIPQAGHKMTRENAAPMLIVWSISSPSPSFFGCRQLALKCWDRGRGSRLQVHVQSGLRSCHCHKRRH